jgi:nucleoside-diphosphate kinase
MIKPEAVRAGVWPDILQIVLRNRFRVRSLEMRRMSRDVAQRFYAEHEGKGFFSDLIEYITSGDVIAVRLEAQEAVPKLLHASDSDASAERELGIIFPG